MHGDGSRLLELFGDEARKQLGSLVTVQLDAREVLQDLGLPALHVYFPLNAVISLLSVVELVVPLLR